MASNTGLQVDFTPHEDFYYPSPVPEDMMQFDLPVLQETSLEAVASLLDHPPSIQGHHMNSESRVSATPLSQFNGKVGTPSGPQYSEALFNELGGGTEFNNDDFDPSGVEREVEMQSDESMRTDMAHQFDTVLRVLEILDSTEHKSLLLDVPNMTDADMTEFWNLYFEKFHKVII